MKSVCKLSGEKLYPFTFESQNTCIVAVTVAKYQFVLLLLLPTLHIMLFLICRYLTVPYFLNLIFSDD